MIEVTPEVLTRIERIFDMDPSQVDGDLCLRVAGQAKKYAEGMTPREPDQRRLFWEKVHEIVRRLSTP